MQPPPDLLLSPAIAELLAKWQTHLTARGLSEASRRAYGTDLAKFLRFLTGHLGGLSSAASLSRVTIGDFRAYLAEQRLRGLSARSLSRAVSALRSFFRWLEEVEGIACPSVEGLATPKTQRGLPRPVDPGDAQALLSAVEQHHPDAWIGARDAAVLGLLWGAGLRISEALGLRWGAAPLGQSVDVVGKGSKRRRVPVLPVVSSGIETYRAACPYQPKPEDPLFLGARGGALRPELVRRAMAEARTALGLPSSATPHALRHAFATQILAGSGDLRAVQELLGHARLSTTQVYTAVEQSRLAAVYDASHPRAKIGPKRARS